MIKLRPFRDYIEATPEAAAPFIFAIGPIGLIVWGVYLTIQFNRSK